MYNVPEIIKQSLPIIKDVTNNVDDLAILNCLNAKFANMITQKNILFRQYSNSNPRTLSYYAMNFQPSGSSKDLVVDRGACDKMLQAGGFISVNTGGVPDANAIPIQKKKADESMDAAACVGCGACVATCKNGSAMLFVSARVSSLALLPQGRVEAVRRAKNMVAKMDELGFGACTNTRACEMECPKAISVTHIARLNREFLCAKLKD